MKALAIDLGGMHATCALVDNRTIIARESLVTDRTLGLAGLLPQLAEACHRILNQSNVAARECSGLALSFCGLVDHAKGRILSTNSKYDDGPKLDLPAWSRTSFGLPLQIENDARMALLGERFCGAAAGFDDVVMVTLGTGIGAAAMIEGRLMRGKHAQAGCLGGHLPVLFNGRTCTCGAVGCAEAEASTWPLEEICRSSPGFAASTLSREKSIEFKEIFSHAEAGDVVAVAVRDRCIEVWSTLAVALVHAYDPEVIVIGGGVMRRAAEILPPIQEYVHRHAWTPWGKVEVRAAQLGNEAALYGSVPLLEGPTR